MGKLRLFIVAYLIVTSCSIGKQEVYYSEMELPPKLTVTDDILTVETRNSISNSALLIYDLDTKVDDENRALLISGFQAVNKEYRTEFHFNLEQLGISNPESWVFYWVDPDGIKHELVK